TNTGSMLGKDDVQRSFPEWTVDRNFSAMLSAAGLRMMGQQTLGQGNVDDHRNRALATSAAAWALNPDDLDAPHRVAELAAELPAASKRLITLALAERVVRQTRTAQSTQTAAQPPMIWQA